MKNNPFLLILVTPILLLLMLSSGIPSKSPFDIKEWVVPESAKKTKNPTKVTPDNLKSGKVLYDKHCKSCHGGAGRGDGSKSKSLNTPSGDFSVQVFQLQTDGAIFYKIREGRTDMPSYKKKLSEEEDIWSLVNYMRTFASAANKVEPAKPKVEEKKDTTGKQQKKVVVKPDIGKKDSATVIKDSIQGRDMIRIETLMNGYALALNNSDTAITSFFTVNGSYIPFNGATAIGRDSILEVFRQLFSSNIFKVAFIIEEIEPMGEIALVRARSRGEHKVIGTGINVGEENRHLIFLKRVNGDWKIYCYMSN